MAAKSVHTAKVLLGITGMTCTSCSGTIEKALLKTEGVVEANVNLTMETAAITLKYSVPDEDGGTDQLQSLVSKLTDAVECVGFEATILEKCDIAVDKDNNEIDSW